MFYVSNLLYRISKTFASSYKATLLVCILLNFTVIITSKSSRSVGDQCTTCKKIVKEFKEGLKKTEKSNFEGGNTHWEESRLGKYATSETRLVEIIDDYICKDEKKECTHMLEESEEIIENYWFKIYSKGKKLSLKKYLCIARLRVCCPENTYGEKCQSCPGGKLRACSGHGKCDGEGTRGGKGTCACDTGYTGEICAECADRYYEANTSEQPIDCKACDSSCKSTCWEGGTKGCDECKIGYSHSEELGCQDLDECESSPCSEEQFCTNSVGSYSCTACREGCASCTGPREDQCFSCKPGYQQVGTACEDVDECSEQPSTCSGEHEHCVNFAGGSKCECNEGYVLSAARDSGGSCIPQSEPDQHSEL